jgi:peptidoglycan hydrolase-like protein with peptidoglycan-binding domain
MGRNRPTARTWHRPALVLALVASLLVAAPAEAAKKQKRSFRFGDRSLSVGAKGKDVRFLQRALTRLGIPTGIDGAFGKRTRRSVKTLEAQKGWPVNGVVSKKEAKRIKKLLLIPRMSGGYFVQG